MLARFTMPLTVLALSGCVVATAVETTTSVAATAVETSADIVGGAVDLATGDD